MWPICFNLTTQLLQLTQYIIDHWLFLVLGHPVKTSACDYAIIDWMISNHPNEIRWIFSWISSLWNDHWTKKHHPQKNLNNQTSFYATIFEKHADGFLFWNNSLPNPNLFVWSTKKIHFCWVNHGKSRQTTTKINSRLLWVSFWSSPTVRGVSLVVNKIFHPSKPYVHHTGCFIGYNMVEPWKLHPGIRQFWPIPAPALSPTFLGYSMNFVTPSFIGTWKTIQLRWIFQSDIGFIG